MSPLNPYFLQGSASEQRLVQDLINEQLRMYGQDIVYIPRRIVNKPSVIKEIVVSNFYDGYRIEAYLMNYQGFGGNGDVLSKFGVQTTDELTLIISKERYEDFISSFIVDDTEIQVGTRPEEGDIIYLPLDNTIFEIKYVEGKAPFYQLNNLYVYELKCEVFDYEADDDIDTSIPEVDNSVKDFGYISTLKMVTSSASVALAYVGVASALSFPITGNSVSKIDLINDGTGYLNTPNVLISAPPSGVNATAVAIMTNRSGQVGKSIDKIFIVNPGIGYSSIPTVTIIGSSGSGAIATAIISPNSLGPIVINSGGLDYSSNPIVTISAPEIVTGTTAKAEAVINSLGIVTSIRYTDSGSGYLANPSIIISSPIGVSTGNYVFNETVTGSLTGAEAQVDDWDYDTRILKVKILNGEFALGETVSGMGTIFGGSNANYKILSFNEQDDNDPYSENISIQTESDKILDFSEQNPFGDY
jgi:hypothetical protein